MHVAWTTCPYIVRDGKVNPDVRTLYDSGHFNDMAQSVLYKTIAFALTKEDSYARTATSYLSTWFIDSKTAMNPHARYAQFVRGPNASYSYIGVLDLRGLVKVVNAVQILRHVEASLYTVEMDKRMVDWGTDYLGWLTTSDQGTRAGNAPK